MCIEKHLDLLQPYNLLFANDSLDSVHLIVLSLVFASLNDIDVGFVCAIEKALLMVGVSCTILIVRQNTTSGCANHKYFMGGGICLGHITIYLMWCLSNIGASKCVYSLGVHSNKAIILGPVGHVKIQTSKCAPFSVG